MKKLVLASTSKYRQEQLKTLGIIFEAKPPLINEDNEKDYSLSPEKLAQKLSFLKAKSLASEGQITIGGDQLVCLETTILGKPGTIKKAEEQLWLMQGKTHELITAISVFDGMQTHFDILNITKVKFKSLTQRQIKNYVELDLPLDCAGSYKIEKHGIQLIEKIETSDFTAIQGIPLLELSSLLLQLGIKIPQS